MYEDAPFCDYKRTDARSFLQSARLLAETASAIARALGDGVIELQDVEHLSWRNVVSTRKPPTDGDSWGLGPSLMLQAWTAGLDAEEAAEKFWKAMFDGDFLCTLRSTKTMGKKVVLAPFKHAATAAHKDLL